MALEGVDDIEGSNRLALGVWRMSVLDGEVELGKLTFSVCDSITNDTLKEGLQNTTGLLVDHG